jgi:hypothetical protein
MLLVLIFVIELLKKYMIIYKAVRLYTGSYRYMINEISGERSVNPVVQSNGI